jgi:hypothetical protein
METDSEYYVKQNVLEDYNKGIQGGKTNDCNITQIS